MKTTGIVRGIDRMGRVVIPREIRRQHRMENDLDEFDIFMEGDKVILKKFRPSCIFCDAIVENIPYEGYMVCKSCIEKLQKLAETDDD